MQNDEQRSGEPGLDLKHDTMEFSATTDGDEPVEDNSTVLQDEAVTAEELDALEAEPGLAATALTAAERVLENDEDKLPAEDWTDDIEDFGARVQDAESKDKPFPRV